MNNNNKVNALYSLFLKRKSEYNSLIVLLLFPMGERMNTIHWLYCYYSLWEKKWIQFIDFIVIIPYRIIILKNL